MHNFAAGCLCLFLSLSSSAFGQAKGFSLDSFRVIETHPDSVDIELTGSNDGSLGTLFLGSHAKSEDTLVQSAGFSPIVVPVGQQLTFAARVFRPLGLDIQHTDYLYVIVYASGKSPALTFKLAWKYDWPAKSANAVSSDNETQTTDDSAARTPGWPAIQDLEQEDFAGLDRLLEKWNDPAQRDSNGEWKLSSVISIFYSHSWLDRNWKAGLERIHRWQKSNPKSAGAAVAEATYWMAYALHIRGGDYLPSTDPVAVKVFGERMKRAEQVLKASKAYASTSPLWYEAYMLVALHTKRDIRFTERLFAEGIRKNPYFGSLYLIMANYWSPVDGGKTDWRKVDDVVGNAVALASVTDGGSIYARLYKNINKRQKLEFELFRDSYASWSIMRDSFDEIIERYPSPENINEFAAYACQAADKDTYLRLRAQMKDRILSYMWPSNYSPDMCDHKFMLYS